MDITILVAVLILTSIIQSRIGYRIHGYLLNPITLVNIIFLLNNWGFSFSKLFIGNLAWSVPGFVSYDTRKYVLLINLISLWLFFLGYLQVFKKAPVHRKFNKEFNFSSLLTIYLLLTTIFLTRSFALGLFSGTYGHGQPLNSEQAFDPIGMILDSRIIFGSVFLITSKNKSKKYIILIEVLISILSGIRKGLIIALISFLLSKYEKVRIDIKKVLRYSVPILLIIYILGFIAIYRSFSDSQMTFTNKMKATNNDLVENALSFATIPLLAANSEGVQNWTFQLIESGKMKKTYGLTYLQALVNTIILRPFQGNLVKYQAAYYFKKTAYPGVSDNGFDFSYMAEAILNFGYLAPLVSLFLGIIISIIYRKRYYSSYFYVLYIILMSLLFVHFRTDSTALLRELSIYIISFVVLRKIHLIRLRRVIYHP